MNKRNSQLLTIFIMYILFIICYIIGNSIFIYFDGYDIDMWIIGEILWGIWILGYFLILTTCIIKSLKFW